MRTWSILLVQGSDTTTVPVAPIAGRLTRSLAFAQAAVLSDIYLTHEVYVVFNDDTVHEVVTAEVEVSA